jgi:hypothetical protein
MCGVELKKNNVMKALLVALIAVAILIIVPFIENGQVQAAVGSSDLRSSNVAIKIYSDSVCKKQVTSLNWGSLNVGSSKSIILYVRNEGKTNTRLVLNSTNWSPANAPNYMQITWNNDNRYLNPGSTLKLTLTLTITQNTFVFTNFNCDVIITATN